MADSLHSSDGLIHPFANMQYHVDTNSDFSKEVSKRRSSKVVGLQNGDGKSCHQCKSRKSEEDLYYCSYQFLKKTNTKTSASGGKLRPCFKKYCQSCMKKSYPEELGLGAELLPSGGQAVHNWVCPCCRNKCQCVGCTKPKKPKIAKLNPDAFLESPDALSSLSGLGQLATLSNVLNSNSACSLQPSSKISEYLSPTDSVQSEKFEALSAVCTENSILNGDSSWKNKNKRKSVDSFVSYPFSNGFSSVTEDLNPPVNTLSSIFSNTTSIFQARSAVDQKIISPNLRSSFTSKFGVYDPILNRSPFQTFGQLHGSSIMSPASLSKLLGSQSATPTLSRGEIRNLETFSPPNITGLSEDEIAMSPLTKFSKFMGSSKRSYIKPPSTSLAILAEKDSDNSTGSMLSPENSFISK